ncbi:hypothetical protein EX30DRAFT_201651 [Ascodesmis nigricans]|uniref:Uncharacterized protein n=1 Tax=Ascodesmis nigricans TaxID=341454 RepID=A0A4S2MRC3_9PEZI|nr:hypothetical protein EX30DRAFT_201651 [Ascodesmis nigricans]
MSGIIGCVSPTLYGTELIVSCHYCGFLGRPYYEPVDDSIYSSSSSESFGSSNDASNDSSSGDDSSPNDTSCDGSSDDSSDTSSSSDGSSNDSSDSSFVSATVYRRLCLRCKHNIDSCIDGSSQCKVRYIERAWKCWACNYQYNNGLEKTCKGQDELANNRRRTCGYKQASGGCTWHWREIGGSRVWSAIWGLW